MIRDPIASLQTHFGFTGFRPGQAEAIRCLLNGQHALVVMPTGAGKSLIYQLTSLFMPGITLVISPLIALMKDQVDGLVRRQITATFINSTLSSGEQNLRLKNMAAGKYRLVYIAPERLRSVQFQDTFSQQIDSLLAVDEAHCISEWGHDFRPDYLQIAKFRARFGNPLTVALTATATPQVQAEITRLLNLPNCRRIVTGFNRPNLVLEVRYNTSLPARLKTLLCLITGPTDGGRIIYTGTRRDAEEVADFVRTASSTRAEHYHAGLPADERNRIQEAFIAGDLQTVVATSAFGMGIDRPDVRQVIHFSIPGSLEAYYQEAGRAGRDGLPAQAVLLYSPEDRALQEWFIKNSVISIRDLQKIYETVQASKSNRRAITMSELCLQLGLPEIKARVGLAELERAGMIDHPGDEGLRMWLETRAWNEKQGLAIIARLKQHQELRKHHLDRMIAYAESNRCRRLIMLQHFGDPGTAEAEACCDNCATGWTARVVPISAFAHPQKEPLALILLECVQSLKYKLGREKVADILKGSRANDILRFGYHKSPYYGKLSVFKQKEIKDLLEQLIQAGYLKITGGKYPVLNLAPKGQAAVLEKKEIQLRYPHRLSIKKIERVVEGYQRESSAAGPSPKKKPVENWHPPAEQQVNADEEFVISKVETTILDCVEALPNELPRSGLAKLLVGSMSERIEDFRDHPFHNRLAGYNRTEVLHRIDQLIAHGVLVNNEAGFIVPGDKRKISVFKAGSLQTAVSENELMKNIVDIGENKSVSWIPVLIDALKSPNGNIRRLAASALGKIGDPRGVQPLLDLLVQEKKPQVRQYAVKALGRVEINDPAVARILSTIAADSQEKDYTRQAARTALRILSIHLRKPADYQDKPLGQPEEIVAAFLSRPHPRSLPGPWDSGWALDFHSRFTGGQWSRTETGELAFRLKYQGDLSVIPFLLEKVVAIASEHPGFAQADAVVPVPPSMPRPHDPVLCFAGALSERLKLAFLPVLAKTRQTQLQKDMQTLAQKQANVTGAFELCNPVQGKRLLVVDDLFDSGATLIEITRILRRAGADRVHVLTLTRSIHSNS